MKPAYYDYTITRKSLCPYCCVNEVNFDHSICPSCANTIQEQICDLWTKPFKSEPLMKKRPELNPRSKVCKTLDGFAFNQFASTRKKRKTGNSKQLYLPGLEPGFKK